MPTAAEYEAKIKKLKWAGLRNLWAAIVAGATPGWDPGKAFEYLILRAYELNKAVVKYPYSVVLDDEEIEQIDGSVRIGSLYALVEVKDEADNLAIAPVAKMRNQLMRRPGGVIGLVFSRLGFTRPAQVLARYTLPQAVLLWGGDEVEFALENENLAELTEKKFRRCVDLGLPYVNIME